MHLQCSEIELNIPDFVVSATRTEQTMLVMAGINFRTASICVREKAAFSPQQVARVLQDLHATDGVLEAFVLSTCNRTELYTVMEARQDCESVLRDAFLRHGNATHEEVTASLYAHIGVEAARHLFRVAAGLESMVLGEAEIVHQIKRAATQAREEGTLGTVLQRLIDKALSASKQARTQARYDECGLSVASVAVSSCKRIFGDLDALSVLVLGAGETAELTLHYLVSKGVRKVLIANRTYERAAKLARVTSGEPMTLDDFPARLHEADVIICCSSSPHPILTPQMVSPAMARRNGRRVLIVDIAVPRDVEPTVGEIPGVQLLNIDNLQGMSAEFTRRREEKLEIASNIVDCEATKFGAWLASRKTVTAIMKLREQINTLRAEINDQLAHALCATSEAERAIIAQHTDALVRKVLCEAINAMQDVTGAEDTSYQMEVARKLIDA